jgi:hypothetical protein
MNSDFHCSNLAIEHSCNLLVLQLLETAQHQNLAFLLRQHQQSFLQERILLLDFNLVSRADRR